MSKNNSQTSARLNFLYQSAHLMLEENQSKKKNKNQDKVANYYSQLMISIGHKSVQRLSREIKRTICKGCRNVLIPGINAKVQVKKKKIGSICQLCNSVKSFPVQKKK